MRTSGGVCLDLRRGDICAPVADAKLVRDAQTHVAVNARTGVPARVGKPGMIHAHRQHIFIGVEFQMGRQIALETRISIRPSADRMPVDPDFRVVVHAVELNRHDFVFVCRIQAEMFAIAGDSSGSIAVAAAPLGAKRALRCSSRAANSPAPGRIVEFRHHGLGEFTPAKEPISIKVHIDSGFGF